MLTPSKKALWHVNNAMFALGNARRVLRDHDETHHVLDDLDQVDERLKDARDKLVDELPEQLELT